MAIIWLIENENSRLSLTWLIMARYALRVFKSIPTCIACLKSTATGPNILVLNSSHEGDRDQIDQLVQGAKNIPLITIGREHNQENKYIKWIHPDFTEQEILRELDIYMMNITNAFSSVSYKDINLNKEDNTLFLEGEEKKVSLTAVEAKILKLLLKSPSKQISRMEITEAIWGQIKVAPRTLDTHICRLRSKIISSEVRITNHYASGYSLD